MYAVASVNKFLDDLCISKELKREIMDRCIKHAYETQLISDGNIYDILQNIEMSYIFLIVVKSDFAHILMNMVTIQNFTQNLLKGLI